MLFGFCLGFAIRYWTEFFLATGAFFHDGDVANECWERWDSAGKQFFSRIPNMRYPKVLELRLGQVLSGFAG